MAVGALSRLALKGPVPVHAVVGANALAAADDLSLDRALTFRPSPRHAGILLVAGAVRDEDRDDLRRLHDQLPHPRATVFWRTAADPHFEAPTVVDGGEDPAGAIADLHRRLIENDLRSERDLQPNEPPNPWRGKGDFGQGGEGMMGGTPYGRPMAMTDDDLRDGLQLDPYTAEFGPFLATFPPGLKMKLTLQGDVIQSAQILRPPFPQEDLTGPAGALRMIARQLRLLGLPGHATRALRAAAVPEAGITGLRRLVDWSGAMRAVPPRLGLVGGQEVRDRLAAWWETAAGGTGESRAAADAKLVDLLPGLEWNEAMLVINSFDPATLAAMSPVEEDDADEEEDDEHHDHGGHEHHHHAQGGA